MTDNALALIEPKNVAQYFAANGLDPVIEKIREQVAGIVPDISTEKGRKEIASLAYKVAKSKTALDEMGKNLVSGMKEQVKAIDAERSRAWDAIEAIQHEVRAPLTEWEDAEKERVARHEDDIGEIVAAGRFTTENWQTLAPEAMVERLKEIEALTTWTWQEFATRAKQAIEEAAAAIRSAIAKREAYDAEQAELARLRQEEADRKQREHEERIAAEAAARAQAEAKAEADALAAKVAAEQKAAAEREEVARREVEEAEARAAKAEADRLAAIERAEAQARQAEADRLAAIAQAESDRKAAEEKAERDRLAAAKGERDRIAAEKEAEAKAAAKREADKKIRAKVNNEALYALLSVIFSDDPDEATEAQKATGREVIKAIASGQIPHVRIVY